MITQKLIFFVFIYLSFYNLIVCSETIECSKKSLDERVLIKFSRYIVFPALQGLKKGDAGKIAVIGGSEEYTGAPYFAAISALKVGADLVHVITTRTAAPVIKAYSPDLIVHPILEKNNLPKINKLIEKMDVVVIGPGLGREDDTMLLTFKIIETCKKFSTPLVIDADGLYAIHKNISLLQNYSKPGVILTPNFIEAERLKNSVNTTNFSKNWYNYWGENVTVLIKGKADEYHHSTNEPVSNSSKSYDWSLAKGGSYRRAGGQGDILAGALGTFYNWALKSNICNKNVFLAKSVAAFAASKLTRMCNEKAFSKFKRGMTASDMLHEINGSFMELYDS